MIKAIFTKVYFFSRIEPMEEKDKETDSNKNEYLIFGKIPIIAVIFPPIGFAMLVNYLLNKQKGVK